MARAIRRRSPPKRVMPADWIATSAPVLMAMPTSAAARAGASLMPSPARLGLFVGRIFNPSDGLRDSRRGVARFARFIKTTGRMWWVFARRSARHRRQRGFVPADALLGQE